MKELLNQMKKCPLFQGVPEEVLKEKILPFGKLQELPKDSALIRYQERVDQFSVLISGRLHTLHSFEDGTYSIFIVHRPGGVAGVDLLWTGTRVAPYFVAASEPSQVLNFPASILEDSGLLEPRWRYRMMENALHLVSQENMRREYRLAILSRKGLRERILTYLSMQAARRRTATFTIPFSREELASYLCVNRSAMCHELSLMQQDGLIRFRKNEFTLCNWEPTLIP